MEVNSPLHVGRVLAALEQLAGEVDGCPQVPGDLRRYPKGGEPHRLGLQGTPDVEEVVDLLAGRDVHERTLSRAQVDEPVTPQQLQCLADRAPADAQRLREVAFDQPGARRERTAGDHRLELLVDPLT